MKNLFLNISYKAFFLLLFNSCQPSKSLEIVIPSYQTNLVVECYLEKDSIYKLSLLENVSYFELPRLPVVYEADVKISYGKDTIELFNILKIDTTNQKFYNYISYERTPEFLGPFNLIIKDKKGRVVHGTTRLLPVITIDTVHEISNEEKSISLNIKFKDPPEKNFYRCIINKDSINGPLLFESTFGDELFNSENGFVATGNRFNTKDKLMISLYNIDKPYYEFLSSVKTANLANSDPFAQPTSIKNSVTGGLGIFTCLSVNRKRWIVK